MALCSLGLMYVPDPVAALREMHRALRPGGRAVVAVWGPRARCGWAEIFPIVDARVQSEVCPMFFHLGNAGALERCFEMAGFAAASITRVPTTIDYDSADEACGAAFAGGPVARAYSRIDAATRQEAHAEYLQSIATYGRGDGYAIPAEFVVAQAVRACSPPNET